MPTRTERLARPTSLEILSKHKVFRKLRPHMFYNDIFGTNYTGYSNSRSTKRDRTAAANWLAYHGNKVESYDNLKDDAIQTLVDMF